MLFENYFYIIYLTSFFASIVSVAIGFIGGTLSLAVMAHYFKMTDLIPLHGIVQLSSNFIRSFILQKNINWKIANQALIGIIVGAVIGYFYISPIPEKNFNLIMGVFIIFITLFPKFSFKFNYTQKWLFIGFISCSIGLYVGAIGTLVGAFLLQENLEKKSMIATQATLQSFIHFTKIIFFSFLGFSLSPWILLILGAIIFSYFGTKIGALILDLIPQEKFRIIVKIVILILSLNLIRSFFF